MKRILCGGFCLLFFFSFATVGVTKIHAAAKPTLSLSDAVLADLALHNYLDYISIDFKDKKSPNTITINEEKQWLPASTVKLFVAMYAVDQIEKKTITLDQWITINAKNVVPTELETSDYPVLTEGLTTTVDILLRKMITQSDNTAYNTLLDLLDRQKVTSYIQSLGLTHTIVGSKLNLDDNQTQYEYTTPGYNINTTTASDYAQAYDLIDNGKILGSTLLFNILKLQKIQNMIPAFLPVNKLTIAHKTGDLAPLYHDGGIIIGDNKHYILTIFTNLNNPNILAHISQLVYTQNYQLVGSKIPDKDSTPQVPQALDPLVMNPQAYQTVLAATTAPINVPIPQITAADLGIGSNELSLVIPDNMLPKSFISPTSPLHTLIPVWYAVQNAFAIGQKNRQQVALSYAQQLLSDAKTLQKNGDMKLATNYLDNVQQVLNSVASDHIVKPDTQTQIKIQAISQTQFATLQNQVQGTTNDDARTVLLQQVANQAKQTLKTIAPNIPEAKLAASPNQSPLIGHIVDDTPGHIVIQTPSGQNVNVNTTDETKITSQNALPAINSLPSPTPSDRTISAQPTSPLSPTPSSAPLLKKGATVALVGSIQGDTFTPAVVVTDLHRELAAPQPVTVVKVNTKNNTLVVDENGIPIQVDVSSQTAIKAKDTNIPLQAIQVGSVVVVHGTAIQQVSSDTKQVIPSITPSTGAQSQTSPTTKPSKAISPTQTAITPTVSITSSQQSHSTNPTAQTTTTGQPVATTGVPQKGTVTILPTSTTKKTIPTPSSKPVTQSSNTPATSAPVVIRATSVQFVQQKSTSTPQSTPSQSQPQKQQPAQSQPAQNPPAQPQPQKPTNNSGKKSGH